MDLRKLQRLARKHGWRIERGGNNHLRWISPTGEVIYGDCTPSDKRGINNTVSRLRKAGLPVPHKGGRAPRERKHG